MSTKKRSDDLIPITAKLPRVAYERIKQEAKRRKVSIGKVVSDLMNAIPKSGYQPAKDIRLEKFGFSYEDVDWDNAEEVRGIIIAECVMHYLPPSPRELQ